MLSRVGAGKAWILQRIRANHPFFTFFQRDIDEYLPDRAWLFWTSLPVTEEVDWSPIGIPHADIEIFHHDGHWQPYDQAACPVVRAPEGWTEHSIPSFWGERAFQARLVEVASGRACSGLWLVIRQPGPGLVGRLRPWSEDAQLVIDSLLHTYPMLCEQGRVMMTIESEEEVRAVKVKLYRVPPKQSKCSLAERFRELFFRSSRAVYLTPQAGEVELCPSHIVKDVYEAAGIGEAIAGDRKWLYRDNSVEALRSSLAAA